MRKLSLEELKEKYIKAYNFIQNHDLKNLPEQRYDLGDDEYVNIESYNTFDFNDRKYESHKKYIDIQCIVIGRENIIVESVEKLNIVDAYNDERDIAFYSNNVRGTDCFLETGDMLLLEPQDGHMPCISIDDSTCVKKAVFKFKI